MERLVPRGKGCKPASRSPEVGVGAGVCTPPLPLYLPPPPPAHPSKDGTWGGDADSRVKVFPSKGESRLGNAERGVEAGRGGPWMEFSARPHDLLQCHRLRPPAPSPDHKVTMWPLAALIGFLTVAFSGGKNARGRGRGGRCRQC